MVFWFSFELNNSSVHTQVENEKRARGEPMMIFLKEYRHYPSHDEATVWCSCGNARVVERMVGAEKVFRCASCAYETTWEKLRADATDSWLHSEWNVQYEKRRHKRITLHCPVQLRIQTSSAIAPFVVLNGIVKNMSETGLAIVVSDFDEKYQEIFDKEICDVTVHFEITSKDALPPLVKAQIVHTEFNKLELPACRMGLMFLNLHRKEKEQIRDFMQSVRG
jgi:hypothetical protein